MQILKIGFSPTIKSIKVVQQTVQLVNISVSSKTKFSEILKGGFNANLSIVPIKFDLIKNYLLPNCQIRLEILLACQAGKIIHCSL